MKAKADLTGKVFGRLMVGQEAISRRTPASKLFRQWVCLCQCGEERIVRQSHLLNGNTTSCGCRRKDSTSKHGAWKSKEYAIWRAMQDRCRNPNNPVWKNYGGRGIHVCERWRDYQSFMEDMGNRPDPAMTLERIDNNQGYSPENCRWETRSSQNRNRRDNRFFTHNGKTQCLADWARDLGITRGTLSNRLRQGWPIERAITEPANRKKP